jgi:hypothetical protein
MLFGRNERRNVVAIDAITGEDPGCGFRVIFAFPSLAAATCWRGWCGPA